MTANLPVLTGQTALVVGLAREGTVAALWLAQHGAQVVASDVRPLHALGEAAARLADHPGITLRLGPQTPALLTGVDVVVVSPGVPQDIPLLRAARAAGIPLTTETRLLAQLCPALLVGITGSSGKTTTTTLTARMLEATGVRRGFRTWLGGNIGEPLLGRLEAMQPEDRVVLELSSFQLLYWGAMPSSHPETAVPWHRSAGLSPAVAAILNITPNHLDRHPSMAHYAAAKAQILAHQRPGAVAVLNRDDPLIGAWARAGRVTIAGDAGQEPVAFDLAATVLTFGLRSRPWGDGAWWEDGAIRLRHQGEVWTLCHRRELKLRGEHNVANVMAAACLALAAGADPAAMAAVATAFTGVPHRLEVVRQLDDVLWINDSIATSPERAIAALRSFETPEVGPAQLILLAGGRDKHLPWEDWAAEVHARVRHVVAFGEAAGLIARVLQPKPASSRLESLVTAADLPAAVRMAHSLARPGDVVLLAPGGTSFDAYADYAARGQHFRDLVNSLVPLTAPLPDRP
jgi:UDP-N-acetylmuramoylalanine--D-glutamate ligase